GNALFELLIELNDLFRPLAQLIEQSRVLNRNNGLGGEILQQPDLLVGEWTNLLVKNGDCTNQLTFLEHRYGDDCPRASLLDQTDDERITFDIGRLGRHIRNVYHCLGLDDPENRIDFILSDYWLAANLFSPNKRGAI